MSSQATGDMLLGSKCVLFLQQFPTKQVGDASHRELWIPAERVEEMNRNIIGKIEVIAKFSPSVAGSRE